MPRPAIHPGEILRDELAELGVTPTELARQIEVPPNRVTEIIHGRRSITGDTSLREQVHTHRQLAFLNFSASSDPPVASPAL